MTSQPPSNTQNSQESAPLSTSASERTIHPIPLATEVHSDLVDETQMQSQADSQHLEQRPTWMGDIPTAKDADNLADHLVSIFNQSPFFSHSHMRMYREAGDIIGRMDFRAELVGNVAFGILHGGATATLLDSIGGVVTMLKIFEQGDGTPAERLQKISRVATLDMRIDYLKPGRGAYFLATAEVLRLGRRGSTTQMRLVNDAGELIAQGIASYAF